MRIAILVSGGGTNLQAIIDNIKSGELEGVDIAAVISSNHNAYALERARDNGIPRFVISPKNFKERRGFDDALTQKLMEVNPDLIVLAGYLAKIPAGLVNAFKGRIINVHPSLIPSFCGVGYYGIRVHEAALKRGVKITGATVHIVDEDMDTGPILLQKAVAVLPDDTPETLQKRVMEQAEWVILPKAIWMYAKGEII